MPLNIKIDGPVKYIEDKETTCLTDDQARHIYKKVEAEGIINVDTINQEIEEDKLGKNTDEDEVNPYHEIITNKVDKEDISNVVNYVQYDRHPRNF